MSNPPPFNVSSTLEKMSNPDADYRFMALNDLLENLLNTHHQFQNVDSSSMLKITDGVVRALSDQNGEVQNLAVKCLGPLVLRIKDTQIAPLIGRLSDLSTTAQDPSIPSTALRSIISNLPRPQSTTGHTASSLPSPQSGPAVPKAEASQQAINASVAAVQRTLLPKIYPLLDPTRPGGATLDSVDLLVEIVRCFGVAMTGAEVERLQVEVMKLLENDRSSGVVKKRAVIALSLLCVHAPDVLLSSFINHLIESFRAQNTHRNPTRLRLLISITGALARGIPERFGPYLKTLCPFVLSVVDGKDMADRELGDEPDMEMDEVKEAALVALESFQSCCSNEMKRFTDDLMNASTIYMKYDPNYADPGDDDDDDEEMGGTQIDSGDGDDDDDGDFGDDEDDFEDDGNFSDEDDISWKVRRCAAKLLSTVISTRASDLIQGAGQQGGKAYTKIAPMLIDRFHEREENVRLEVLATFTLLINKTGEVAAQPSGHPIVRERKNSFGGAMPPPSFKKRRGSDASMLDTFAVPETNSTPDELGVRKGLSALIPRISKSVGKLLNNKTSTLPTKQASINLLAALVTVLHGGLEGSLSIFMSALVDMAKGGTSIGSGGTILATAQGGSAATATASSVRIEALRLLAKIFENHSATDVAAYLDTLVVPALTSSVNENGYKISFEALGTVIALCRQLTAEGSESYSTHLQKLYDAVLVRAQDVDTDLEVREKSILTLGIILSRTAGNAKWISQERRYKGLDVLLERLKNETTRVTAARAIEGIAKNTGSPQDLSANWVQAVVNECGAQLRKSSRSLRAASLDALKSIAANDTCRNSLNAACKKDLVKTLTPLLVVGDLQLLAQAIATMRYMMAKPEDGVGVSDEVITGICNLVKSNLGSGMVLENLLAFVGTIGTNDQKGKKSLMQALLAKVGVTGETRVVARSVAELFVSGGGDAGGFNVGIQDFVAEMEGEHDERRKSLALMILGEIGLRMGSKFPIKPETFLSQFKESNDNVPIAAAIALGLAGSGNTEIYLPIIMQRLSSGQDSYYLVHTLKEIITHSSPESPSIKSHSGEMWKVLIQTATTNDDSKAAAAECVGRLTVLDPFSFLPELEKHMKSQNPAVRGIVISALRYTFTDTDESYDNLLRPIVVDFLETMLQDSELENRRLALTALNSAASNKPHLLAASGLQRLIPRVYAESVIKPELVREVQMGPFRHRIDDGLEVRKSAYETLYALLETSFASLDLSTYFERVLAGLADDHDIRALANLMLSKLTTLAKDETLKRVEIIADVMKKVLSEKPKDNAVKQEIERFEEGVRGVVKVAVQLQRGVSGNVPKWKGFWDWLGANFGAVVAGVSGEEGK